MNHRTEAESIELSIAAVERDTGLGKDTLRVWERRYGFPQPARDAFGERVYPLAQVEKLRAIKRLMDQGYRPGRIVALPIEELQRLSIGMIGAPQAIQTHDEEIHPDLKNYLRLIREHDAEGLRHGLSNALAHQGLKHFVTDVVAPLTGMVGDAWMVGEMQVHEEHLFTECMSGLLRQAIGAASDRGAKGKPCILLTTFPQEAHGLGLLMAECMMVLQGARCLSLGTQTPVRDIVDAAQVHQVDVVALSFTASMNPKHVIDGLTQLRLMLPPHIDVWAGGRCPILSRRSVKGVHVLAGLEGIAPEIRRWQEAHA
jgi:DNA-binding transcriptional MerR regulator/methylmalonyl-CoA mutase cobalamin-binding subunit